MITIILILTGFTSGAAVGAYFGWHFRGAVDA